MVTVTPSSQGQTTSAVQPIPASGQTDTNSSVQQAPIPEATKPEVSQDPLAPKFAALARQQKMIRQQQRQIEAQRQAVEAERKAIAAEVEQAKSWKSKLTQDPYAVMLEAGLTSDQAAALLMNQPNPDSQHIQLLKQELAALKAAQEQSSKRFDEVQNQQYEDAVRQIRSDASAIINSDSAYETTKEMGATEAVVELIKQTFESNGRLMSVEEAAQEVEDYLVEEALRIAKIKKVQSKLYPAATTNQNPNEIGIQKPQQSQQKPTMNTLSNRMNQSTPGRLTDAERKQRAILAFHGKL